MSYETFIDALRLFDAVTASIVFGILVYRGRCYWSQYTNPQKWIYVAFTMYAFTISYTSFEMYKQDPEVGIRSYFILVANMVAIYALSRRRDASPITASRGNRTNV